MPPLPTCPQGREHLEALQQAGRIERLYQETQADRWECKDQAAEARSFHLAAASALGLCDEGPAPCAPVADPEALIDEALAQKDADPARARRLFDRASRGLEAQAGRKVLLETLSSSNSAESPRVTFSPDGRWLAGAIGTQLTVVDAIARRKAMAVLCTHSGATWAFGEGFLATLGCEGAAEDRTFLAPALAPLRVYALPSMRGVALPVEGAATMAVGRSLVALADRTQLLVLDGAKGAIAWRHVLRSARGRYGLLAFDRAASELFARDSDGAITVFAAKTGAVIRKLTVPRSVIDPTFFSPDGPMVLEGSVGKPARAWSVTSGAKQTLTVDMRERVTFSSDGKRAALWGARGTDVYDVATWKLSSRHALAPEVEVLDVIAASDGFLEAERDEVGAVSVVDPAGRVPTAALPVTLPDRAAFALGPGARSWAWLAGEEYSEGSPVHIGENGRGDAYPSHLEGDEARNGALSNDATLLVLSRRPELSLIALPSARVLRRWPISDPNALLFSPDGESLAAAHDALGGVVDVLDVRTGELRYRISDVYRGLVAFSPDGSTLAIAPSSGGPSTDRLRLFHAATGNEVARMDTGRFSSGLRSLVFESDSVLVGEGYSEDFAVDLANLPAGWKPRTTAQLDAARPLGRCSTSGGRRLEDVYGSYVRSVTSDCRFALIVRENQVAISPLAPPNPVLVIEAAHEGAEMFFRLAATVERMDYGAETIAHLGNGTQVRAPLQKGSFVFLDGVQPAGPRARSLVTCRIGPRVLPLELCEERLFEPELVERFFRRPR